MPNGPQAAVDQQLGHSALIADGTIILGQGGKGAGTVGTGKHSKLRTRIYPPF